MRVTGGRDCHAHGGDKSWSTFLLTEGDDQLDLQPLVPEQVKKHRVEEGEAGSGLGGLGRTRPTLTPSSRVSTSGTP